MRNDVICLPCPACATAADVTSTSCLRQHLGPLAGRQCHPRALIARDFRRNAKNSNVIVFHANVRSQRNSFSFTRVYRVAQYVCRKWFCTRRVGSHVLVTWPNQMSPWHIHFAVGHHSPINVRSFFRPERHVRRDQRRGQNICAIESILF